MKPISNLTKLKYKLLIGLSIITINSLIAVTVNATTRISSGTGNFSNASSWTPSGIPASGDVIVIQNNHTITVDNNISINSITISTGGRLIWNPGKKLTISTAIIVNGFAEMNDGDIDLTQPGSAFKIGPAGSFTWQPANNTSGGASLFTNGTEDFHPTSTLIITKWYNYTNTPLGSVVSGNFGNLAVTTLSNGLLYEWNQNNQFEQHKILGKFTIDQGWIVLDKSGTISNTFIGEIYLKNVNSYFDLHSGDHPGNFTVKTNSLTNIGGNLNGIYNGNGNINLEVNGDVLNLGNIELIYNSGVQNTSNGNAAMKVTGLFKQTTGDFRGIFNISSTTTGKVNLEFGSMELTGGIFMAQYACHTNNELSTVLIKNDLNLNFINTTAKFRGNGLNSLSGVQSNLKLQLTVLGNVKIKGNQSAEFTSSASTGQENVQINGDATFEGCNSNFNFGSHPTNLIFNGNVIVNGGLINFSKTEGSLTVAANKNLLIQSGQLNIKNGKGNGSVIIEGDYNQTGGFMYFHNNDTEGTPNAIYVTVNGNFNNNSGTLNFDNNSSSTSSHILSIAGNKFSIGGTANITSTISQFNPVFGNIYYDNNGIIEYEENNNTVKIQNVKQVVSTGCILELTSGNMQAASFNSLEKDMIRIAPGGAIDAGTKQIYSNGIGLYSGIKIDENGILKTANSEGLYNGASNATLKANGNFTYTLNPLSTIEYYGPSSQIVTGTGVGTAQNIDQQYGILLINKTGSSAKLTSSTVNIRTALDLNNGELTLNGYNLTIHSGSNQAIRFIDGYIKSEMSSNGSSGLVVWKNIEGGSHLIPFGTSPTKSTPFIFTPTNGLGKDISVSTRSCTKDNRPLPPGVSSINLNNSDVSNERVIDRWYQVNAVGITANITCSYLPNENTTNSNLSSKNFSVMVWKNSKWNIIGGIGNGETTTNGNVTLNNCSTWGHMLLVSNEKLEQADLLSFEAILNNKQVDLKWISLPNIIVENFIIERSADGFNFEAIAEKAPQALSSVPLTYIETDASPVTGVSYYRLRQSSADGKNKYSNTVRIEYLNTKTPYLNLSSVGPNPFSSGFTINYEMPADGIINARLISSHGQLAFNKTINSTEGKNNIEIKDLDQLTPGIYILSVSDGISTKSYKLFKN